MLKNCTEIEVTYPFLHWKCYETHLYLCILTSDNKVLQYLIYKTLTSLSPVTCVMWNLEVCAISAFRNDSWVVDGFNRKPRKKKKKSWLWLSYINYVKLWRSNQSRLTGHVLYACIVTQPWCLKAADIGFVQIILHLPVIFNSLAVQGFYISLSSVPQNANKECCLFQLPYGSIFNHFRCLITRCRMPNSCRWCTEVVFFKEMLW